MLVLKIKNILISPMLCGIIRAQMTPVVLFFQSTTDSSWRGKLEGVYRFSHEAGWLVHVVEANSSPRTIKDAFALWKPIGCMVDRALSGARNPVFAFAGVPTVYLDQDPRTATPGITCVNDDSAGFGRLAAEEFLKTDIRDFSYVPYKANTFWNAARERAFAAAIRAGGRRYVRGTGSLTDLPRPCGLLCAEDAVAQRTMDEASRLGLRIPQDLLFIGIDNDPLVCEHTHPTLTSVIPDFEGAGYKLAESLACLIDKPTAKPRRMVYSALGIARRESSRPLVRDDARVNRALAYLREHIFSPELQAADVAEIMGCSRSLADLRFREITGRSIREEIRSRRFERAYELLRNRNQAIDPIAHLCGYVSQNCFKTAFKRETGLSMREWRKQHTTQPDLR